MMKIEKKEWFAYTSTSLHILVAKRLERWPTTYYYKHYVKTHIQTFQKKRIYVIYGIAWDPYGSLVTTTEIFIFLYNIF